MAKDIYQKLAQHLDDLPAGFPSTESGVELRILRRLFSPEEAELAIHLSLFPEESEVIAGRAEIDPEEAAQHLDKMAKKGLIYSISETISCRNTELTSTLLESGNSVSILSTWTLSGT